MGNYVIIGNSHIKVYNDPHKDPAVYTHDQLTKSWKSIKTGKIFLASVVPALSEKYNEQFKKRALEISSRNIPLIKNLTRSPEKTGIDRLLNALAVFSPGEERNHIIVDCGTALSISVLTQNGEFLGGTISAGLQTEASCLHTGTALLPRLTKIKADPAGKVIGKTTETAINNGILWGKIGAVKELVLRIKEELKTLNVYPTQVTITGGWGKLIAEHIHMESCYDSKLTFKGLVKATENLP